MNHVDSYPINLSSLIGSGNQANMPGAAITSPASHQENSRSRQILAGVLPCEIFGFTQMNDTVDRAI